MYTTDVLRVLLVMVNRIKTLESFILFCYLILLSLLMELLFYFVYLMDWESCTY